MCCMGGGDFRGGGAQSVAPVELSHPVCLKQWILLPHCAKERKKTKTDQSQNGCVSYVRTTQDMSNNEHNQYQCRQMVD